MLVNWRMKFSTLVSTMVAVVWVGRESGATTRSASRCTLGAAVRFAPGKIPGPRTEGNKHSREREAVLQDGNRAGGSNRLPTPHPRPDYHGKAEQQHTDDDDGAAPPELHAAGAPRVGKGQLPAQPRPQDADSHGDGERGPKQLPHIPG